MAKINFRRGVLRICVALSVFWAVVMTVFAWDNITDNAERYIPQAGATVHAVRAPPEGFEIDGMVIAASGQQVPGSSIKHDKEKVWLVKTPYSGDFVAVADSHDRALVAVYKHLGDQRLREQRHTYFWFVVIPIGALFSVYWIGIWIARGFVH